MKSFLSASAIAAGVVLLVVSATWAILFPAQKSWTVEKGARLVNLSNQATDLQMKINVAQAQPTMHAGENPAELLDKFRKVDAEYKELYKEFKAASDAPKAAPKLLRWSGIAFVIAGAIIVFANRG